MIELLAQVICVLMPSSREEGKGLCVCLLLSSVLQSEMYEMAFCVTVRCECIFKWLASRSSC